MMQKSGNPRPFRPVSPGEILQDELDARRWSEKKLGQRMGKSERVVQDIVAARRPITAELALALADALGTTAESWMMMEVNYRLDQARQRRRRAAS
jgi:HTH-type transcriptional regulator/antitoxin HigA